MLVVLSDLHLSDSASSSALASGAMELLVDRMCDLAYRASWRSSGIYMPIERIDLLLLGDTLDITGSRKWLASKTRPWSDVNSPAFVETATAITDDILRHNVDAIRHLRSLATEGLVSVPYVGQNGQPLLHEEELPVAVRTHYMVGNRDWPLHLAGSQFDLLRHKVAHHLGLANQHNKPFPHEAMESEELADSLRRHRVLARHGDIFDPLSFSDDRDTASLSDAIAIELVGKFLVRCESELAAELSPVALATIGEIEQIRPQLLIAAWLESQLERLVPALATRKAIKRLWDNTVEDFLELEIVRHGSRWSAVDLVDGLASALKFSRRDSHDWTGKTLAWLADLRGAHTSSYAMHALAESDFRNRRARSIVYGHTHTAEQIPLDASHADGFVLSQTYFNAGTWRRTYQPTQAFSGQHEFISSDSFHLLAFYQQDERSGRAHETLSGSLAPSIIEAGIAPAAPVASAAAHPIRAPHFAQVGSGRPSMRRS